MKKKQLVWGLLIFSALFISGCAVANPNVGQYNYNGSMSGFWAGLWHGLIAPITVFISLFNREINIYEVYNTGFGYNIGFLIGLSAWAGGAYANRD